MLNNDLKTFSKFLRKERVSVTISVVLGLCISVGSYINSTSSDEVMAQAVDAEVLTGDIRNSLAVNVVPSEEDLARVESEHVAISVKENVIVTQGYSEMAEKADSTKESYDAYLEEQQRLKEEAERQRQEEERKRQEEIARKTRVATFKTTGYCSCSYCCGSWSPEVTGVSPRTATGSIPCSGRTVAVDPSVIPLGSTVIINGHSYIAEDTGSAVKGNVIDIYFGSHSEASNWGCRYTEVTYILK